MATAYSTHINTVIIPVQESTAALAAAFAGALASAVGWELDEDGVTTWVTSERDLGVRFAINGSNVYPVIVNNGGTSGMYQYTQAPYSAANIYQLNWFKTSAGTVALGVNFYSANTAPSLTVVVGKNDAGVWSAIHTQNAGSTSSPPAIRSTTMLGAVAPSFPVNYNVNYPLALSRLPDLINGGLFVDIYFVVSSPTGTTSGVFYINGKYFRPVKLNNPNLTTITTFAIPVG